MSKPDILDLTSALLKGYAPYIQSMKYVIEERMFALRFFHPAYEDSPVKELCFREVYYFEDTIFDFDPTCVDSLVGLHKKDEETFVMCTEQREFFLKTKLEPETKWIQNPGLEG
jgi:hypothetical protein